MSETIRQTTGFRVGPSLRPYKLSGRVFLAHPVCRPGFVEDRKHGLIYGPTILTLPDGSQRWAMNQEETSRVTNTCAYCGQD